MEWLQSHSARSLMCHGNMELWGCCSPLEAQPCNSVSGAVPLSCARAYPGFVSLLGHYILCHPPRVPSSQSQGLAMQHSLVGSQLAGEALGVSESLCSV